MPTPAWVQDAVFYQIFPDRFANGDPGNDPFNVRPWGEKPTVRGFQGGDLRGIIQHIDDLRELGIDALYLNPIFQAASTHRYDTIDYLRVDPQLGNLQDFHDLIRVAHQSQIRVILDGVFNHCGRGFFAFVDLLENEADSPYRNWFHVERFPLRAYERTRTHNYQCWWGIKSLPKFNTNTPAVRRYLLDVARYWIEQGADGWRLDVPNEIDDDDFWAEFRQVVRQANPDAYLLGEIWDINPRWANDTHFDGLMNYPVSKAIIGWLDGTKTVATFQEDLRQVVDAYPQDNLHAMFVPLGTHDTTRVLTQLNNDLRKLRLAFLLQFGFPGAPSIYYGDEIGMQGGPDPDCRRAFPWQKDEWNQELRSWVKQVIAARKSSVALRRGSYQPLAASEDGACCAFARLHEEEVVLVAANVSNTPVDFTFSVRALHLPEGAQLTSLLNTQQATVRHGKVTIHLEPVSGVYLR